MKRQILCLALVISLWACPVLGREIGWPAARADISHPKAALKKDTLQFPSIDEEKKERRILQAILARPEFRYDQMKVDPVRLPARYTAWIHDLLKKIAHLMARLFSRGSTSIRRKSDYPWLFSRYILMALLGVIALILVLACRNKKKPTKAQMRTDPAPLGESPGYWAKQADVLISEGRTRDAFRSLYLALLLGFHRLNYIDFCRSQTNWNYLTHFRGGPQAKTLFQDLTRRFDLIWYGRQPLSMADYRKYKQAILGVLNV